MGTTTKRVNAAKIEKVLLERLFQESRERKYKELDFNHNGMTSEVSLERAEHFTNMAETLATEVMSIIYESEDHADIIHEKIDGAIMAGERAGEEEFNATEDKRSRGERIILAGAAYLCRL